MVHPENMDDFLIWGETIEQLEIQVVKLMDWCKKINLKLSPKKFKINTTVKFSGMIVSGEKIKNQSVVFIDPPDGRIQALTEMKRPENKKKVQILCGCIAALQAWTPNILY